MAAELVSVVTAAVLFAGGGKVVAQDTCGAADLYLAYVAVTVLQWLYICNLICNHREEGE